MRSIEQIIKSNNEAAERERAIKAHRDAVATAVAERVEAKEQGVEVTGGFNLTNLAE